MAITKKAVIFASVIVVIATMALLRQEKKPELSQRAREYIAQKKKSGEVEWRSVGNGNVLGAQTVTVGNCFTLSVPLPVSDVKKDGECFRTIITEGPRTTITAYQKNSDVPLGEESGVTMRRSLKETYREYEVKPFTVFYAKKEEHEYVGFSVQDGKLIVVTMRSSQPLNDLYAKMLSSVTLLP